MLILNAVVYQDMITPAFSSSQTLSLRVGFRQVSATFKRLFPEDFDRAIPVIKHYAVDKLLFQMDYHMGQYELVGAAALQHMWYLIA